MPPRGGTPSPDGVRTGVEMTLASLRRGNLMNVVADPRGQLLKHFRLGRVRNTASALVFYHLFAWSFQVSNLGKLLTFVDICTRTAHGTIDEVKIYSVA